MKFINKKLSKIIAKIIPLNKKVAIFIVNYNMPERADALFEHLKKHSDWPIDIYMIDNGSNIQKPSQYTNIYIKKNVQTCRGWLRGLEFTKEKHKRYFAYMFLITSANFVDDKDPITPMIEFLIDNKDAVGIHPALSSDSTTYWSHLITRGGLEPRKTWMIDNIASVFKADWFDSIGWFDAKLIYAWGIDLETCYLARKQGKTIWVDERVKVKKITNIGYKMNRMNMKATERIMLADTNMREILKHRYGKKYWKKMTKDYITPDMQ